MKRTRRPGRLAWLLSLLFAGAVHAVPVMQQLDWVLPDGSTLPESRWGQFDLDYTGFSTTQFLNLVLTDGTNDYWAIQNLGLSSLFGTGQPNSVSTFFDLGLLPGVSDGTDVGSLDYQYSIDAVVLPTAPVYSSFDNAVVGDLSYQIGGEDGADPAPAGGPGTPDGANKQKVKKEGKLKDADKFQNQVQKENQCAPGAVSSSLKYLKATGTLPAGLTDADITIDKVSDTLGKLPNGRTPANWYETKKTKYGPKGLQVEYVGMDVDKIIKALEAGKDIEIDLKGHVMVLAGIRQYEDGTIEIDYWDDNQTDNTVDPLKTTTLKDGKFLNMEFERFVVEGVPEPGTLAVLALGLVPLLRRRRRRSAD